jgi:peptidoglycan/LPS O-acetylase OafA/YrhL
LLKFPPRVAWHVPEGGLWAAILLAILVSPGWLGRLVTSAPLVGLGLISYSVYLLHYPILEFSITWLERTHPGLLVSSLAAAAVVSGLTLVCLGASMLTYAAIERPPMRWRQQRRA